MLEEEGVEKEDAQARYLSTSMVHPDRGELTDTGGEFRWWRQPGVSLGVDECQA